MLNFKRQEALKNYPFIQEKGIIILNFISLDSVEDIYLNEALYYYYPSLSKKIYNLLFEEKMTEGNILPFTQTQHDNIILNIPYKENYNDNIDESMIEKISDKVFNYIKEQNKPIHFCNKQISEDLVKKYIIKEKIWKFLLKKN